MTLLFYGGRVPDIQYENTDGIVVLRVIGAVTFTQITEAMSKYFPLISKHLIWDYTEGDLENVSPYEFRSVPEI
jgi:hypothetical protein